MSLIIVKAAPVDYLLLDGLNNNDETGDYDMMYDQRQNGTENFRLHVDGVVVAFPASATSHASAALSNVAANYLLQLASAVEDADDDDSNSDGNDPDNYFNFVKNANKNGDVTSAPASEVKYTSPQAVDIKSTAPAAEEAEATSATSDQKSAIKSDEKTSGKPAEYSTESITVESIAALNTKTENAADVVAQRISSMNSEEYSAPKVVVVPVKKIQARRRNK